MTAHRPLRVALLTTSVEFGGVEQVVLNLLDHMEPGVELFPVVFTRTETADSTFFRRLRDKRVAHELLLMNALRPVYIANPIANVRQALTVFRRERFDLVHCHGYRANAFGALIARLCGIPAVATCHGYILTDRKLRAYKSLDTRILRLFARVVAVSGRMREDLVADGLDPARVEVITNAVADVRPEDRVRARGEMRRRLGVRDDEIVFGYVGRLSSEKGPGHLLRAARLLTDRGVRARYVLLGDGPERAALEAAAAQLGLGDAVHFAGFQSETASWYAAMDVFVLPSLTEGTPVALLEAMAHGLAPIASKVGGVPAVVSHMDNGMLVEPGDDVALAAAMADVAGRVDHRASLAARARESVARRYGMRDWIARTIAVYRGAVSSHSAAHVRGEQVEGI